MNPKASTKAREGDLPREALVKQATAILEASNVPAARIATVYFKFNCGWCGARCTLAEPDTLYELGECFDCGKETIIDVGGFMVTYQIRNERLER